MRVMLFYFVAFTWGALAMAGPKAGPWGWVLTAACFGISFLVGVFWRDITAWIAGPCQTCRAHLEWMRAQQEAARLDMLELCSVARSKDAGGRVQ